MILCRVVGHACKEGRVIRRTNEILKKHFRKVFVILECQRCGHLQEAARCEIDRFQFPNGVEDYLNVNFRRVE